MIPRTVRGRLAVAEIAAAVLYLPHAREVVTASFDSYTHMFFASHYLLGWFTTVDNRWYMGFETTTYPPLAHQLLALVGAPLRLIAPLPTALEFAYVLVMFAVVLLLPLAVYRYTRAFAEPATAALAAVLSVVFSGTWMMVVVYGQLPTLVALLFGLLGASELARFYDRPTVLGGVVTACLTAAVPMTHHFSAVSILPVLYGAVVFEQLRERDWRTVLGRGAAVAVPAVVLALVALLPFVLFSLGAASRPVIPHGSRPSWLQGVVLFRAQFRHTVFSGLLFLLLAPVVWHRATARYQRVLAAAAAGFAVLGLGYTTPLPSLVYGSMAEQLTYYRFAIWGGLLLCPAAAGVLDELSVDVTWSLDRRTAVQAAVVLVLVSQVGMTTLMGEVGPTQPSPDMRTEVDEIGTFLGKDEHYRWRYLALGMSQELGAIAMHEPRASTIDGGYHRARDPEKLPLLVETGTPQLANAKYARFGRGGERGDSMDVLDSYLSQRDELHLKYVFSADRYYADVLRENGYTLLYGSEWSWLGIRAWYDPEVPPRPEVPPPVEGRTWEGYLWGTLPLAVVALALVAVTVRLTRRRTTMEVNPDVDRSD